MTELKRTGASDELVAIGKRTGTYGARNNKQILASLTNKQLKEFDEYLDLFKVDGKIAEGYEDLYNGLKKLRVKALKGEAVDIEGIKTALKDYRRHHIFTVAILRENEIFRDIMEWGLKNGKKFGFNDWGKNIIIIHTKQHGTHKKFTERIMKRITKELAPYTKRRDFEGAYDELIFILEDEINLIKDQVIKQGKHLNEIIK